MAIISNQPLSMGEVLEYLGEGEKEKEAAIFIKKFAKIDAKKAKALREKIEGIQNMKIKPEHVVKLIDFLPETQEDLNKIFSGTSLNEDESATILNTIKEFK